MRIRMRGQNCGTQEESNDLARSLCYDFMSQMKTRDGSLYTDPNYIGLYMCFV